MAVRRHLRLVERSTLGEAPEKLVRLVFDLIESGPLGFRGGQFVIMDTGLPLSLVGLDGAGNIKRAFSIASSDLDQHRFEVLVQDVGVMGPSAQGIASHALCGRGEHALAVGDEFEFGGPWGKVFGDGLATDAPRLLVATDNGITAALGFLHSKEQAGLLGSIDFVWLNPIGVQCLDADEIARRLPKGLGSFHIAEVPAVDDPGRIVAARAIILHRVEAVSLQSAWLVGDGALVVPLGDDLIAAGMNSEALRRTECFFNAPGR